MGGVTGLLMALAVAGALLAVSLKNVLHAIFGLAITLMAMAGLFVVLNSPFVATMEVLIYVGGITVAMVFAVMLSTVVPEHQLESVWRRVGAGVVALGFFIGVGAVIVGAGMPKGPPPEAVSESWSIKQLGTSLLGQYNVVFEVLSVILLLAIIGAIVISRHELPDGAAGLPFAGPRAQRLGSGPVSVGDLRPPRPSEATLPGGLSPAAADSGLQPAVPGEREETRP